MLDPFPRAPGGYEHLVVAIDYFTKWIETELLNTISSRLVQKFFWRNIVYRFGIPRALISDKGCSSPTVLFKIGVSSFVFGNTSLLWDTLKLIVRQKTSTELSCTA